MLLSPTVILRQFDRCRSPPPPYQILGTKITPEATITIGGLDLARSTWLWQRRLYSENVHKTAQLLLLCPAFEHRYADSFVPQLRVRPGPTNVVYAVSVNCSGWDDMCDGLGAV